MSSPEVERFEVTEDDLMNEFYPRAGRRQTKNQAIYGMWADDSDDERPGFSRSRKKDMVGMPVNFVSGGFKQGDKITKDGDKSDEDQGDSSSDSDSAPAPVRSRGKMPQKFRGSKFNQDKEFGGWEKYTKGIGQKLLQKMGFEHGKGLGKTNQGITTPVEAVKRKAGRAAVGAYGSERSQRSLQDYPVYDSEEEEDKKFKEQLQQWKKQPEASKKAKGPKYVYKSAQEVIDSGGKKQKPSQMSKVKVIDMTGKEKRVLTGYHAISHRHEQPDEEEEIITPQVKEKRAFEMPELTHNLNILVDMAEEDIIQNDRKLRHGKDHIVNMKHEKERLDQVCEQEDKLIMKLRKVLDIVESCEKRTLPGCDNPLTLDETAGIFKMLQDDFYEEYRMYDLAALAVALVFPLMKQYFNDWDPLGNPRHGREVVKQWQYLLEEQNQLFTAPDPSNMDVYQRLLWDIWLPVVRRTILNWNVRNCDALIEMLEIWMPVLPPWIMENILNQLVFPRLLQEVETWNPLTDTMPIHAWLHPWLPLMGDKLEPLYAPIRHKIASALTNWHPSDTSAKVILQPWVRVFKQGHMEAFLVKNIVPKLGLCMQEFVINPHQQILDPFNWVMSWSDIIPIKHLVGMLEKTFFPKWLNVLCTWLSNMPNYEEVTKWYLGWKSMFSDVYLSHPTVKDYFNKALDIMNRAVSGNFQPGVKENMAYFAHNERKHLADAAPRSGSNSPVPPPPKPPTEFPGARSATGSSTYPTSFKDLLEKKAEENGILFMPIQGRTQEAKQVYRFGKNMIYLDRSVVFICEKNNQWVPISLQNLVDVSIG